MARKFKPANHQPAAKFSIKRNDQVVVIAGKDKGKKGRVIRIITDRQRVIVEGVAMIKKHVKADPSRRVEGGVQEREAAIHISNVMLLDSEGNATRVGAKVEGETKSRVARSNGGNIAEPQAAAKS